MAESTNWKLYNSLIKKRIILIMALLIGLAFLLILNIAIGSLAISIPEILRVLLTGKGDGRNPMIIREIRLPRALMVVVIGAALGIGGVKFKLFFATL